MDVAQRIRAILNDEQLHSDPAFEPSKCAAILAAIAEFGWEPVRASLLEVLHDAAQAAHWRDVAHALWEAVLDHRPLPVNEVIALLYHRFDPYCRDEDNLVWSTTSKLKGLSYLSDYNPCQDPVIARELQKLRRV